MSDAVFDQLNLVARDVDATVAFFRAAGVAIPDGEIWRTASGAHHVEIEMPGGASLGIDSEALAKHYDRGYRATEEVSGRVVINLRVDSRQAVDGTHERLVARGYQVSQPPYDTFWGARYAVFLDPDGNRVGVMSPPDPKRRSAPPAV